MIVFLHTQLDLDVGKDDVLNFLAKGYRPAYQSFVGMQLVCLLDNQAMSNTNRKMDHQHDYLGGRPQMRQI